MTQWTYPLIAWPVGFFTLQTFIPADWVEIASNSSKHTQANQLMSMPCFEREDLQLYVVVKRSRILPRFDTRFVDYGYNRQQWIQHLRYLNFDFKVFRDGFVIDVPHPQSAYQGIYEEHLKKGKPSNQLLFESFMKDLKSVSKGKNVPLINKCAYYLCFISYFKTTHFK